MDFEKPPNTVSSDEKVGQPPPTYDSQTFPSSIRRKPVGAPVATNIVEEPSNSPPQITTPLTRPSFLSRTQTRWRLFSKRTKIIITASLVAILVLIIGLSAGLATHHSKTSNLPLPSSHGGPYTGDLTYYDPGLGACGITSGSSDTIVAISHLLFDAVSTSSNPNANPLCRKKIRARRNGKSVDLTVVDRCVGCQARDLDVTESVFGSLADIAQGRVTVEWAWLEDVPGDTASS